MLAVDLEIAYREHAVELIRFATAMVGPHEAGDVVTEAMVRVFDGTSDVTEIVNLRAYLFKAVHRQAIDYERSRSRRTRREGRYVARRDGKAPLDETAAVAACAALSTLSQQQRSAVFLTYWLGLSPSEIADELGVSDGTIRKQLAGTRPSTRGAAMTDPDNDAGLDAALEQLVRTAGSDAPDAPKLPFVTVPAEGRPTQRGLLAAVAAVALVIAGVSAVFFVNRGNDQTVTPIDKLPQPTPAEQTAPDSATTPSSSLAPASTPIATTATTSLDRPIVDPDLCAPVYARELDVDGITLFAHVSSGPATVQVIGDSNLGPTGPFATVVRYPAGTVLPPPSTQSISVNGNTYQVRVYDNGNGVMQWNVDDGTIGYLRSRGLDLDALTAIASGLTERPPEAAVPGFDFTPPESRSDLGVLAESLDSDVHGRSTRSECRMQTADGPSYVRVATLSGDPILQFAGVIDRPPPTSVTRVGNTIVVIDASGEPAPTAADVVNADEATWADLLTRSDRPELDAGREVTIDKPVPVMLINQDTDTPASTLTLRLVDHDGVVFLEVDTTEAVVHPDAVLWVTTIEGRGGGKSSVSAGGVLGYRLGDAPLTGEVNVTIETVDLTDTPLQSTLPIRLIPT